MHFGDILCVLLDFTSLVPRLSLRAIIPRMTFDPPEGKADGEPGRFCHMTSVMLRHPYIRYRLDVVDRTASMSLYLCIVGICSEKPLR